MYVLTNRYGNVKYRVATERERDELLLRGLREVKEEKKAEGEKKNVRKNKNSAKAD